MSDDTDYGDDFEDDEDHVPGFANDHNFIASFVSSALDDELLTAARANVAAHESAAAAHQKGTAARSRSTKYSKWAARGPDMKPGSRPDEIASMIKEAGTKPGPGEYRAPSFAGSGKAAAFTKGRRIERKIDDEEGAYLDPLNSTTLTRKGTVISPARKGKRFMSWNEEEVGEWLDSVGLGHLSQSFQGQKVKGEDLIDTTPDDLRDILGVQKFADRKRLNKELKVRVCRLPVLSALPFRVKSEKGLSLCVDVEGAK